MPSPPLDPLDQVTPLILTYNEEANLSRTLAGLSWARRIVVIDSGSTDATLAILARVPQVEVLQRTFDGFAQQCTFGLAQIKTPWCLSLDADHVVTSAFRDELRKLIATAAPELTAILTPFRYLVYGRPLRGTLLPPRINVLRTGCGRYLNHGHSHHFITEGATLTMRSALLHDDRKPLSRWLDSQRRYLAQEAALLRSTSRASLSLPDRLRRTKVLAAPAVFLICLIWHRGLLDGWRGWFYALQRAYAEILLSLMLWEAEYNEALKPAGLPGD
jgi:hypothetical protein